MKITKAILSAVIIWTLIFLTFTIMSFIPVIKDSELQQNMLLWLVLVPITMFGVKFYYKRGGTENGITIGLFIIAISFILDAIITVPYVIIPHGGDYYGFFMSPFLWITALEIVFISIVYSKMNPVVQ
jgi:uncharacterized protein DUF5367